MCGRQYNGRLDMMIIKDNNHLLVVQKNETKLLNIAIKENLTANELSKIKFDGSANLISYFDSFYGMLYVVHPKNGNLMIFINRSKKAENFEQNGEYIHTVEYFYQEQLKFVGEINGISATIEGFDDYQTRLRIIISDSEGIKFGKLWINKYFFGYYPPREEKHLEDIIQKFSENPKFEEIPQPPTLIADYKKENPIIPRLPESVDRIFEQVQRGQIFEKPKIANDQSIPYPNEAPENHLAALGFIPEEIKEIKKDEMKLSFPKPPSKTQDIGVNPMEDLARRNEIYSLIKDTVNEGIHTQFTTVIMPIIENSFKV